jgi:branched-chain amino acid transport system ATP-binding protein
MFFEIQNLKSGYGSKQVLHDISLNIKEGEIVSIIGHNGAGKSTTLKAAFGLIPSFGGRVLYEGRDMTGLSCNEMLENGIFHLPQENFLFNDLDVATNLELSFFTHKDQSALSSCLTTVFDFFPVLKYRQKQLAGTLSGGERRLLGIAMGLLREPKLLLIDEPSSGLSPVAFKKVLEIIEKINTVNHTAILLVEQNVKSAFKISKRVYVMKAGAIILEESGANLLQRDSWWDLF